MTKHDSQLETYKAEARECRGQIVVVVSQLITIYCQE